MIESHKRSNSPDLVASNEETAMGILKEVSNFFDIPVYKMQGKSLDQRIVKARHTAMFLMQESHLFKLRTIGMYLGGRHYSTVMEAVENVASLIEVDPVLNSVIADLKIRTGLADSEVSSRVELETPDKDRELADAIIQRVSGIYDIKTEAIVGRSRKKHIAEARQVAMYLMREKVDFPLKRVGLYLGNRDHSTIIHGVSKIQKVQEKDPTTREVLETVSAEIEQSRYEFISRNLQRETTSGRTPAF